MREFYICIDFDGTIVDHDYPDIGKPVLYAIKYIKEFQKLGAKIILFTMRSGEPLNEAVDYLKECGIELFGVNINPTQKNWTSSPKAYGNLYIDDAAFGCPIIKYAHLKQPCVDWSIVGPLVVEILEDRKTAEEISKLY